jgi:nucleotide-binding universal stress UspA family protein
MPPSPRPKLRTVLQGVLAGGVLAVSAPLLSFSSFWWLMVVAGAASAVSGASLWLAALTLLAAALVYAIVILAPVRRASAPWARNGRGGVGLSEEEFGGWAIKVNAALAFVLYAVTFLVGISAAMTFLADWLPGLNRTLLLGVAGRDLLGIALAIALVWLVNNRPQRIAYLYGPVTAAVLVVIWSLLIASLLRMPGPHLPNFSAAFDSLRSLELTVAGLARLLPIIAGIEVFATLEPAFVGNDAQRSRKAFGSMAVVTVTSLLMLLVFGPVVLALADPAQPTSAITQVMRQLLAAPLAWLAAVVAIVALLSVAAASAQALQNLSLGLRTRRFAPDFLAQRNRAGVPDRPVRLVLWLTIGAFLLVGAREERYLPLLVAGSILLLMIVSWAAWRRARREARTQQSQGARVLPLTLLAAALFVSVAGVLVIVDGFLRGAWLYLLAAPLLFTVFHFTRRKLGSPNPLQEELGRREGAMRGLARPIAASRQVRERLPTTQLAPADNAIDRGATGRWQEQPAAIGQIAVALDGSEFAERALPAAAALGRLFGATLALISVLPGRGALRVLPKGRSSGDTPEAGQVETEAYLSRLANQYRSSGVNAEYYVAAGPVAPAIDVLTRELGADLLVMSTHGRSGISRFMLGSNASALIQLLHLPVLLLRPQALERGDLPEVRRVLVTLDGSSFAERVLPWVQRVSEATSAQVLLLAVPEVPEPSLYGAMADVVDELRAKAEANARRYLERVAVQLLDAGMAVQFLVEGSRPATTILDVAERNQVDLIMLATRGRGGMERLMLGSVADRVVHHSRCPILLVPARNGDA